MPQIRAAVQPELLGVNGPLHFDRFLRNARFAHTVAMYHLKRGSVAGFRVWMKVAHRSIGSARRARGDSL